MSGRRVNFGPKPGRRTDAGFEAWARERGGEGSKRLTIDMPASLHVRIKARCAMQGVNIKRAILEPLNEKFPE